jgi:hypothetical protein
MLAESRTRFRRLPNLKINLGIRAGPKRDQAVTFTQLRIVHNQTRVIGFVDIQLSLGTGDNDLDPGPATNFSQMSSCA